MAFQAGGPHAQDRGLEAVAYAWDELSRVPAKRAMGEAAGQERADPHGEALPRRAARHRPRHRLLHVSDVERLSRPVREPRHRQRGDRQAASGRDPAAGDHGAASRAKCWPRPASTPTSSRCSRTTAGGDVAQQLALRPEVRIIDFTGSTANGRWLEEHARQAQVYTEKAGVNQIIVDSAADIKAVARNIAFSLSLYSGQMCTAPQNIYVPRDGIDTADGHLTFDQVAEGDRRRRAQAARRSGARRRGAGCGPERRRPAPARSRAFARHRHPRHAGDRASRVSRERRCARRSSSSSAPPTAPRISTNGSARSPS